MCFLGLERRFSTYSACSTRGSGFGTYLMARHGTRVTTLELLRQKQGDPHNLWISQSSQMVSCRFREPLFKMVKWGATVHRMCPRVCTRMHLHMTLVHAHTHTSDKIYLYRSRYVFLINLMKLNFTLPLSKTNQKPFNFITVLKVHHDHDTVRFPLLTRSFM